MSATQTPDTSKGIDCSPAWQEHRRQMLKDLVEKRYSGVQSLTDRSRSVTYVSPEELNRLIRGLEDEIALCDGTLSRRAHGRRIFTPPLNKWL
jgi:hypothetical protein